MEDKINYSYIIILPDEDGEAIDLFPDFHEENGDILIENEESEEQFEKGLFKNTKKLKIILVGIMFLKIKMMTPTELNT